MNSKCKRSNQPAPDLSRTVTTRAPRSYFRLFSKGIAMLLTLVLAIGSPFSPASAKLASAQPVAESTAPSVTESVYGAAANNLQEPSTPVGTVWTIGTYDGSSAEFSDFKAMSAPYTAPVMEEVYSDWKSFPKGMKASVNKTLSIDFTLDALPTYGMEFDVHILNAYMSVPQMAVYANGRLAGLIQIAGTASSGGAYPYRDQYRLYIPNELVTIGTNELKLEVYAGSYANSSGDANLWYEWDELSLTALSSPASEPLHGRYVHLGTAIANSFDFNDNVTRLVPDLTKWLGIAYSGNMMRAALWSDTKQLWQDGIDSYLQTMKDMNLQPVVGMFGTDFMNSSEMLSGHMSESMKTYYHQFMSDYGSDFAYLEMDNEPGVFGHSQSSLVELGEFLQAEKAATPWLKIVAPGWAYWPTKGTPYGWERNPEQRKPIEALSDLTNGHSYALTGLTQARGGSLNENLLTYNGGTEEGLTKEMMMTEAGANDLHADPSSFGASAYKFAAAFDRELRADIGYADHIMQHTAFDTSNPNYALFVQPGNWNTHQISDTTAWAAKPAEGSETRLRTFRRLAAAYATHGAPLSYSFLNGDESAGRKVYVRAVDTRALGASTIGAAADKQIVSIVNFEPAGTAARHVNVRVTLPDSGIYRIEQYRDGNTVGAAYSVEERNISPYLDLDLTVAAGEAVQLYLTLKEEQTPEKPIMTGAAMRTWNTAMIDWNEAADNRRTTTYRLYRDGEELALLPSSVTRYIDTTIAYDRTYSYTVQAIDDSGNASVPSEPILLAVPDMPITPGGPIYEAEKGQLTGIAKTGTDSAASGGGYVRDMHGNGASISIINIMPGAGNYTLRFAYATGVDATLNLYVNGMKIKKLTFVSTGKYTGTGAYKSISAAVTLAEGPNTIMLRHDGDNTGAVNLDYAELTSVQAVSPETDWHDYTFDDTDIYYSPGILMNINGSWNETIEQGEVASFDFTGTGVRWLSNVQGNMGKANVYIDEVLQDTIDLTAADLEGYSKVVFEKKNLTDGNHTLRIETVGGKVTFNRYSVYGNMLH